MPTIRLYDLPRVDEGIRFTLAQDSTKPHAHVRSYKFMYLDTRVARCKVTTGATLYLPSTSKIILSDRDYALLMTDPPKGE